MAKNCFNYKGVTYSTKEELLKVIKREKFSNDGILKLLDLRDSFGVTVNGESSSVNYNGLKSILVNMAGNGFFGDNVKAEIENPDIDNNEAIFPKLEELLYNGSIDNIIEIKTPNTDIEVEYAKLDSLLFAKKNQIIRALDVESGNVVFGTKEDIAAFKDANNFGTNVEYHIAKVNIPNARNLKGRYVVDNDGVNIFGYDIVRGYREFASKKKSGDKYSTSLLKMVQSLAGVNSFTDENIQSYLRGEDVLFKEVVYDAQSFEDRLFGYLSNFDIESEVQKTDYHTLVDNGYVDRKVSDIRKESLAFLKGQVYDLLKSGNFKHINSEVIAPAPNMALLGIPKQDTILDVEGVNKSDLQSYFRKNAEKNFIKSGIPLLLSNNINKAFVNDIVGSKFFINSKKTLQQSLEDTLKELNNLDIESDSDLLFQKELTRAYEAVINGEDVDIAPMIRRYFEDYIRLLGEERAFAYTKSKVSIYNRTPGQGKQSFFPATTAAYNNEYNVTRMAEEDAVTQGGDYDGDMLGVLMYSLDEDGRYIYYNKYVNKETGNVFQDENLKARDYAQALYVKRYTKLLDKIINSRTADDDIRIKAEVFKERGDIYSKEFKQFIKESDTVLTPSEMQASMEDVIFDIQGDFINEVYSEEKNKIDSHFNEIIDSLPVDASLTTDQALASNALEISKIEDARNKALKRLNNKFTGAINNMMIDKLIEIQSSPENLLEISINVDSLESNKIATESEEASFFKGEEDVDVSGRAKSNYYDGLHFDSEKSINVGASAVGVVANYLAKHSIDNHFFSNIESEEQISVFELNNGEGISLSYPNNKVEDGYIVWETKKKVIKDLPAITIPKLEKLRESQSITPKSKEEILELSERLSKNANDFKEEDIATLGLFSEAVWEYDSELMTDAVDNAKLLILDKLGATQESLPLMLAAINIGHSLRDTVYFFKQREIAEIFKDAKNKSFDKVLETKLKSESNNIRNIDNEISVIKNNNDIYSVYKDVDLEEASSSVEFFYNNNSLENVISDKIDNAKYNIIDVFNGENITDQDVTIVFSDNKPGDKVESDSKITYHVTEDNSIYMANNEGVLVPFNTNERNILIKGRILVKGESKSDNQIKALNSLLRSANATLNNDFKGIKSYIKNYDLGKQTANIKRKEESKNRTPVAELNILNNIKNENKFILSIIGLKNNKNNLDIDMYNYIKKLNNSGSKLIEDFDIFKFVNDKYYQKSIISEYEVSKVATNPFLMALGSKTVFINLKQLVNTEALVKLAIKSNSLKNDIVRNNIPNNDNNSYKQVERWIYNIAISDYLSKLNKTISVNGNTYNLSTIDGRSEFIKEFYNIILSSQNDDSLSDNYFIKSLRPDKEKGDDDLNVKFININKSIKNISSLEPSLSQLRETHPELHEAIKYYSLIISNANPRKNDIYNLFIDDIKDFQLSFDSFVKSNYDSIKSTPKSILLLSNPLLRNYIKVKNIQFGDGQIKIKKQLDGIERNIPLTRINSYYSIPEFVGKEERKEIYTDAVLNKLGYDLGLPVNLGDVKANILYYDKKAEMYYANNNEYYSAEFLLENNPDMVFSKDIFRKRTAEEDRNAIFDPLSIDSENINILLSDKDKLNIINGIKKYSFSYKTELENAKEGDIVGDVRIDGIKYNMVYKTKLNKFDLDKNPIKNQINENSAYQYMQKNTDNKYIVIEYVKADDKKIPSNALRIISDKAQNKPSKGGYGFMLSNPIVYSEKMPKELISQQKAFVETRYKINVLESMGYIKRPKLDANFDKNLEAEIFNKTGLSVDEFKKNIGYNKDYTGTYVYKFLDGVLEEENDNVLFIFSNEQVNNRGFLNSKEHEAYLHNEDYTQEGKVDFTVIHHGILNTTNTYGAKTRELDLTKTNSNGDFDSFMKSFYKLNKFIKKEASDFGLTEENFHAHYNAIESAEAVIINEPIKVVSPKAEYGLDGLSDSAKSLVSRINALNKTKGVNDAYAYIQNLTGLSDLELKVYGVNSDSVIELETEIKKYIQSDNKIELSESAILVNDFYLQSEIAKNLGKPLFLRSNGNWFYYDAMKEEFMISQEIPSVHGMNSAVFYGDTRKAFSYIMKADINRNESFTKNPEYVRMYDRLINYSVEIEEDNLEAINSIPKDIENINKLKSSGLTYIGENDFEIEIDDTSILDLRSGMLYKYDDGLFIEKDGEVFLLNATKSEVIAADGFHGLRNYKESVIRFGANVYKVDGMYRMSREQFDFRKSTDGINTDIYNSTQEVKQLIKDNDVNGSILALKAEIPYYNEDSSVNPFYTNNNFKELAFNLKRGVFDEFIGTDENLLFHKENIIKSYDQKAAVLSEIGSKHKNYYKKNKLRLLSVEASDLKGLEADAKNNNDYPIVKVFFNSIFENQIANIQGKNSYSELIIKNATKSKQEETVDKLYNIKGLSSNDKVAVSFGINVNQKSNLNNAGFVMMLNDMLRNKKQTYFLDIPSIDQKVFNDMTYNDMIKSLVRVIKSNEEYQNLVSSGRLKFGEKAAKAVNNTDGKYSISDINSGRIVEVVSTENLNSIRLKNAFNLNEMMFGEYSLMNKWNEINNLEENNTYIYQATGDDEVLQSKLNKLLSDYFSQNKAELVQFMQRLGSKDVFSSRRDKYSIERSIVDLINRFNDIEFLTYEPISDKLINNSEPFLKESLDSNRMESIILDKNNIVSTTKNNTGVFHYVTTDGSVKIIRPYKKVDLLGANSKISDQAKDLLVIFPRLENAIKEAVEAGVNKTIDLVYLEDSNIELDADAKSKFKAAKDNIVFNDNLGETSAKDNATVFLPILLNDGEVYGSMRDIVKLTGNAIDLNVTSSDVVWIKSPGIGEVDGSYPVNIRGAFDKNKPIIKHYIGKKVKFVLSKDLGVNVFVKKYLEENGYSFNNETGMFEPGTSNDTRTEIVLKRNGNFIVPTLDSNSSDKGKFGPFSSVYNTESGREYKVSSESISNYSDKVTKDVIENIIDENVFNGDEGLFKKKIASETKYIRFMVFLNYFGENINAEAYTNENELYDAIRNYLSSNSDIAKEFNTHMENLNLSINESYLLGANHLNSIGLLNVKLGIKAKKLMNKYPLMKKLDSTLFDDANQMPYTTYKSMTENMTVGELYMLSSSVNRNNFIDFNNKSKNTANTANKFIENGIGIINLGNGEYSVLDDHAIKPNDNKMSKVVAGFKGKDTNINPIAYKLMNVEGTENIGRMILRSKSRNVPIIVTDRIKDGNPVLLFKGKDGLSEINTLYDIKKKTEIMFIENIMDELGSTSYNVNNIRLDSSLIKSIRNSFYYQSASYDNMPLMSILFSSRDKFSGNESNMAIGSSFVLDDDSRIFIFDKVDGNYLAVTNTGNIVEFTGNQWKQTGEAFDFSSKYKFSFNSNSALPVVGKYDSIAIKEDEDIYIKKGYVVVSKENGNLIATLNDTEYTFNDINNVWESSDSNQSIGVFNSSNIGLSTEIKSYHKNDDGTLKKTISLALNNGTVAYIPKGTKIKTISEIDYEGVNYRFNSTDKLWNITSDDIKFRTDIKEVMFEGKSVKQKKVSDKAMQRIYSFINSKFGVAVETYSTRDLKILFPGLESETAFVSDDIIIINTDKVTLDTPVHELGHLYMGYLKNTNPGLYEKITTEALNNEVLYKEIIEKRPDIRDARELGEEIFVTMLAFKTQDDIVKETKVSFIQFFKDLFSSMFKISKADFSLTEDMSLNEILESLGNNIIFGNESIFSDFVKYQRDAIINPKAEVGESLTDLVNRSILVSNYVNESPEYKNKCS